MELAALTTIKMAKTEDLDVGKNQFCFSRLRFVVVASIISGLAAVIASWRRRRFLGSKHRPPSLRVSDEVVETTGPLSHTTAFRERLRLISAVPLFEHVPLADFPLLAQAMVREVWPAGSVVQQNGQRTSSLKVIESGDAMMETEPHPNAMGSIQCVKSRGSFDGANVQQLPSDKSPQKRMLHGEYFGVCNSRGDLPLRSTVRAGPRGLVVLSLEANKLEEFRQQAKPNESHNGAGLSCTPKTAIQKQWLVSILSTHLNPAFGLGVEQCERLADACIQQQVDEREVIFEQGGHDELYIIVEAGMLCAAQSESPRAAICNNPFDKRTAASSPFSEFSPTATTGRSFFLRASTPSFCFRGSTPVSSPSLARQNSSCSSRSLDSSVPRRLRSRQIHSNQSMLLGPGQAIGLAEAFFGAPNTVNLSAHEDSVVWTLTRSKIRDALHSGIQSRDKVQEAEKQSPAAMHNINAGLDQLARRHENEYDAPRLQDLELVVSLGEGAFGSVSLVRENHPHSGRRFYAMKTIKRRSELSEQQQQHVKNEREVMGLMDSIFVVRLYTTYRDKQHLYFLMEPVLGGDLFAIMEDHRHEIANMEIFARFAGASVAIALQHMHSRKIINRDVKPENILLDGKGYLKICDLGLAKLCIGLAHTMCGTPEYTAPEIVANKGYTYMVDWWSLGVCIYEIFAWQHPFLPEGHSGDLVAVFQAIRKGINFVKFHPRHFSREAEVVVRALCSSSASDRLGAPNGLSDLCDHTFFSGFDWDALALGRLIAPFVPPVRDLPVSNQNSSDVLNSTADSH